VAAQHRLAAGGWCDAEPPRLKPHVGRTNQELEMNEGMLVSILIGAGIALLFGRLSIIERRLNRLSRLDAKVDALLRHSSIDFDELQDVPPDVRDALERGETLLAIQRFRQATGAGLKEAKEFVDEVRRRKVVTS
jgi:hypothetical protein